MKRTVTIVFEVDFDEFGDEKNPNWDPRLAPLDRTAEGAIEYAEACMLGEADWPAAGSRHDLVRRREQAVRAMSKPPLCEGLRCKPKGTRFLSAGLDVLILGGPYPSSAEELPPMWHVRIISDEARY
jgi:hypothetical protein